MAYQAVSIASVNDIPLAIADFAEVTLPVAERWLVDRSALPAPDITIRRDLASLDFRVHAEILSAGHHRVAIEPGPNNPISNNVYMRSPNINGPDQSAESLRAPTKIHLIGGVEAGQKFIAGVVEYGFNRYRHFYIGSLVPLGGVTGGEIIAAANFTNLDGTSAQRTNIGYSSVYNQFLFGSNQFWTAIGNSGGVHAQHSNNPTPWRQFRTEGRNFTEATALGGFKDGINDGPVAIGGSTYSGTSLLVPINLYVPMNPADYRLVAIGYPAGVRLMNVQFIEPEAEIVLGTDTWKSFPVWRKTNVTNYTWPFNRHPEDQTSYFVGHAYLQASA